MKTNNHKHNLKKIVRIILLTFAGLLIISGISIYLLIHSYINKIHLIKTQTSEVTTVENEISTEENMEVTESEDKIVTENNEKISKEETTSIEASGQTITQVPVENNKPEVSSKEISTIDDEIDDNIVDNNVLIDDKQVINILFIGSDSRNIDQSGRSDSMIVLSINKETKKIIATSFLRDIYLQIPGKEKNRLNAAYASGGADLLLETLQLNFKFKINKFIKVDFFTFIDIVDEVGGISLEIEKKELDNINSCITDINKVLGEKADADYLTKSGMRLLNGKQALGYARNRSTSKGDFERAEKQREILSAIYEKIKIQDLLQMNDLLNIILPKITTNFTESEILALFFVLPDYLNYIIEEWSIPVAGTYDNINVRGMDVLGIDFKKNIKTLYKRIYNVE